MSNKTLVVIKEVGTEKFYDMLITLILCRKKLSATDNWKLLNNFTFRVIYINSSLGVILLYFTTVKNKFCSSTPNNSKNISRNFRMITFKIWKYIHLNVNFYFKINYCTLIFLDSNVIKYRNNWEKKFQITRARKANQHYFLQFVLVSEFYFVLC